MHDSKYEKLQKALASIREKTDFKPKLALVLGSGLGSFADGIQTECIIPYSEIDGLPSSTVASHKGRFILGYVQGLPVVIMQGRVHYYEGYAMEDVVLPVRLMCLMGAGVLFLTNAAGAVDPDFSPGEFMLISDHISSFVPSPLIGDNIDAIGIRFPDMSEVYDKELRGIIRDRAKSLGIKLNEGVYAQLTGPNFETPAEIRMLAALGADAVGMSTACEAMAARHMGVRVCGISCISNMAAGISDDIISHEEVTETMDKSAPAFKHLVEASIAAIAR